MAVVPLSHARESQEGIRLRQHQALCSAARGDFSHHWENGRRALCIHVETISIQGHSNDRGLRFSPRPMRASEGANQPKIVERRHLEEDRIAPQPDLFYRIVNVSCPSISSLMCALG